MLYQTHHPFSFPFKPFTSTPTPILSPSPTSTTRLLPPLPPQVMECVEAPLKSSFATETEAAAKKPQQAVFDDLSTVNGQTTDDFFVDDLLDFTEGGIEDGFCEAEEKLEEKEEQKAEEEKDSDPSRSNFSVVDDFPTVPCGELSVPADDLADLEWLSNFVEDSFSNYSLPYPTGKSPEKPADHRSKPPQIPVKTKPCFITPVQTKARSKRSRTEFRFWSLDLTDSSSSSSSSSSADSVLLPPEKKQRKRKQGVAGGGGGGGGGPPQPRRCSHCLVQKTPQWRAGPLGAKTLCNACGVRFKSGRLLPEYRPACSPTFSSEVHSNNHRKVLEMRRKKEGEESAMASPPVQSF